MIAGIIQYSMTKYFAALSKFKVLKEVNANPNARVVTS